MGFTSVYRSLQEIFPQIDARLLRAVAIENSKDADVAVEVVLSEVLPYMSKHSMSVLSESNVSGENSSEGGEREEPSDLVRRVRVVNEARVDTDLFVRSTASEDTTEIGDNREADPTPTDEALNNYLVSNVCCTSECNDNFFIINGSEELNSMVKAQKISDKIVSGQSCSVVSNGLIHEKKTSDVRGDVSGDMELEMKTDELIICQKIDNVVVAAPMQNIHVMSTTSIHEEADVNESLNQLDAGSENFHGPGSHDLDTSIHENSLQVELCFDNYIPVEVENCVVQLAESSIEEHNLNTKECSQECDSGTPITNYEKQGESEWLWSDSEMANVEHETALETLVNRSGQNCRADLLDGIIEEAKNNKKTLFSAMESVINLMRFVEASVMAAEEVQDEAARGGLDVLTKVDELKQMLVHAKEANDMHAGEVYGEKAILATEARELQSRLLNLSDERDKSLAVIGEMQQTLKSRLAAAEETRKVATLEKEAKEESAQKAFAEQEVLMEKVIQESKILQQEAEENSKLREFLMDRDRIVDMLQGEILVICQDVRLLKENFDDCVPLSKSISSSQTSCILASSSSSLKSIVTDKDSSKTTPEKASPAPSVNDSEPQDKMLPSLEKKEAETDDNKAVSDDEWAIIDNDAEF